MRHHITYHDRTDVADHIDIPACADDHCTARHVNVYTDDEQLARDHDIIRATLECVHDVGLHEFYDYALILDRVNNPPR